MTTPQIPNTRDTIVRAIESLPSLADRYVNIRCANYQPGSPDKRGFFSLVFKAFDSLNNTDVAIKFFDPDPSAQNAYRLAGFEREPQLLQTLLHQNRCLQLVESLLTVEIPIPNPSNPTIAYSCQYFVTEWIPDEIDAFFEEQHDFSAAEKLRLFRLTVLGVQALHQREVFHRDLKPDNFRSYCDSLQQVVIAIDLGTAARLSSPHLTGNYTGPVGAIHYSSPEALVGLAGVRPIAHYSDIWALGCLLFELFNKELFFEHFFKDVTNAAYIQHLSQVLLNGTDDEKLRAWNRFFDTQLKRQPTPSRSITVGHSVPPSISQELDRLLANLTAYDFKRRVNNFDTILRRIDTMLTILENDRLDRWALQRKREKRAKRLTKRSQQSAQS